MNAVNIRLRLQELGLYDVYPEIKREHGDEIDSLCKMKRTEYKTEIRKSINVSNDLTDRENA